MVDSYFLPLVEAVEVECLLSTLSKLYVNRGEMSHDTEHSYLFGLYLWNPGQRFKTYVRGRMKSLKLTLQEFRMRDS